MVAVLVCSTLRVPSEVTAPVRETVPVLTPDWPSEAVKEESFLKSIVPAKSASNLVLPTPSLVIVTSPSTNTVVTSVISLSPKIIARTTVGVLISKVKLPPVTAKSTVLPSTMPKLTSPSTTSMSIPEAART